MKKRAVILFVPFLAFAAIVATWMHFDNRSQRYQGKTIAEWSVAAYKGDPQAVDALKKLAPKQLPVLIRLAEYQEPAWRVKLRSLAVKSPRFIRNRYAATLAAPDAWLIRNSAVRSLGLIGPESEPAIQTLGRIMKNVPNELRTESARALGRIGKEAIPVLMSMLKNGDLSMQSAAMSGLGEAGPVAEPAIPLMLPFLEHPDGNTRLLAGYNLERIGPAALFAVIDLQNSDDESKRRAANDALARQMTSLRPPVVVLRDLTQDKNADLRRRAMESLGKLRPATSFNVRLLVAGLKDSTPEVRVAAIKALENIGIRAAMALPELNTLANDTENDVRLAAALAAEKIQNAAVSKSPPPTN